MREPYDAESNSRLLIPRPEILAYINRLSTCFLCTLVGSISTPVIYRFNSMQEAQMALTLEDMMLQYQKETLTQQSDPLMGTRRRCRNLRNSLARP